MPSEPSIHIGFEKVLNAQDRIKRNKSYIHWATSYLARMKKQLAEYRASLEFYTEAVPRLEKELEEVTKRKEGCEHWLETRGAKITSDIEEAVKLAESIRKLQVKMEKTSEALANTNE